MLTDEFLGHRHTIPLPMSDDWWVYDDDDALEREQAAAIELEIERFERLRAAYGAPPNDLPDELADIVEFIECTGCYLYDDETGEFIHD